MKSIRFLALAAISTLAFSITARAADIKYPEKTDPAFSFTVGDDVKSAPDGSGNLIVQFPGGCALSLTMIEITPELEADMKGRKDGIADLAKISLEAAKAQQNDKVENVEIDGKKGRAFFGTLNVAEGATVDIKLVFIQVDDKHIASIGMVTSTKAAAADKEALEKEVKTFKFTKAAK